MKQYEPQVWIVIPSSLFILCILDKYLLQHRNERKKEYGLRKLSEQILTAVSGKENVQSSMVCMTRHTH